MVYVTRREVFSASHRLFNKNLSDEENAEIFGKCSNPNGHGHNYVLEVVVAGEIDSSTGYVIDLSVLKKLIHEHVISKVDHKNLNDDVDFLAGQIPSSENIAVYIAEILQEKIKDTPAHVSKISVWESENACATYKL